MLKWPCRAFKPRLLPGCGYVHAREVKFRGISHPAKLLAKRKPPTDRMDEKCQTTSQSCDNRVHPVSQYAGTLWETSCGCVLYSSSGRLAITVLRHNRDIIVAQRASFRQGAPENRMLGVFAASRLAYASILPYHSAINVSTAQEDVLCGDHNGVAPKRQ